MNKKEIIEEEAKLLKESKEILIEIADVARPFVSGDILDEAVGIMTKMGELQ